MLYKPEQTDMEINEEDVRALIEHFGSNTYRTYSEDKTAREAMKKCIELAKLDYNISVLDNSTGELCAHYPSQLIIMESENNVSGDLIKNTIYEDIDSHKLRDLIIKARSARCRSRFPVPVIYYNGKSICRSATLTGSPDIYCRFGLDFCFAGDSANSDEVVEDNSDQKNVNNWVLCNLVRKEDVKLLKALNVSTIADFMVEKKKVKFGLNVTSSEKADKENRYSEFTLLSIPYPGCEFFKEFRNENYSAENLYYNWNQTHKNAEIMVPREAISDQMQVEWKEYKKWNLPTLTENYLLLLLRYTFDSSSGLLVHCIIGWDRTPLFISLLRICLWADGLAHKNLTPIQMLYFTIAYDWLLFGHNLADRKSKGEDIFYFCFDFLKFVMSHKFSFKRCKATSSPPKQLVTHPDEDMQCDEPEMENSGELASCSQGSQGSNHSLHSSRSSIDSKCQEILFDCTTAEAIWQHVNSTGSLRSTSGSADSSHSRSSGSGWQHVNSTGSLRSTSGSADSSHSRSSGSGGDAPMRDSGVTSTDAHDSSLIQRRNCEDHSQCGTMCAIRRSRLDNIRKLFANCYCQSIGLNFKGKTSGISNILGSLAGKIYTNKVE